MYGFARMDKAKRSAIASLGGKAAHAKGVAHQWNAKSGKDAGRKGGQAISKNREHMAAIGRRGAAVRNAKRAAAKLVR